MSLSADVEQGLLVSSSFASHKHETVCINRWESLGQPSIAAHGNYYYYRVGYLWISEHQRGRGSVLMYGHWWRRKKKRHRCCMFLPLCAQGWLWMCLRSSWALSRKSGLLSDCSVDRERCSCSRLFTDTQSHCSLSVHIRESTEISSVNRSNLYFNIWVTNVITH